MRVTSAILSTLLEAGIEVSSDDALIELGAADIFHGI